jgi:predicted component of type VI protein secretion system
MFLGPALGLISVGVDMYSLHQEREYEQKMSNVRQDITSQFQSIAADLKQQIEEQLRQAEIQLYGQIEQKISEARQQTEGAIAASSHEVSQLVEIRKDLKSLLTAIQQIATSENHSSQEIG